MPGTTLVREALRRVSVLLQDLTPQFNRWTQKDLVDWLNDGQAAIATYIPSACSRIDALKLRSGSLQSIESITPGDCKDIDGASPADAILGTKLLKLLCNMGSNGTTEGKAIRGPIDSRFYDQHSPYWRTQTYAGVLVNGYAFDPLAPRHFSVDPPVRTGATVWVRAMYCAQPAKVPNAGDEDYTAAGVNATLISIGDEFLDELVHYVCARAHLSSSELAQQTAYAAFAGLFTAAINAKASVLTGTNPNLKRLPFAPEPIGSAS